MLRSALYPLICMTISATVLAHLVLALGNVVDRAAAVPAALTPTVR
jgi:hypothetical protein